MEGLIYRAAVQSEDDPFEYVMSDETVDRMGEVIHADGWDLSSFKRNPIGLFNHHADAIIGRWENVRIVGRQLRARFVFAEEGTSEIVDTARKLWNQKILRGASVGFKALKREPLTKDADPHFGPFRYVRQQLFECSLVSVPANPNAMPVLRSYCLPLDVERQIFGVPAKEDRPTAKAGSRVPAKPLFGGKPMSLSKRIETAQRELTTFRDQLTELSRIEEPDDDQIELINELQDTQIPTAEAAVQRLEKMERTLAVKAADDSHEGGNGHIIVPERKTFAMPKRKIDDDEYVYRALATLFSAHVMRQPPEVQLRERYNNDETTGMVLRAAVNPAMTGVAGWAQELTQTINQGFMDRLIPNSIYPKLSARGMKYTFSSNAAQIKIPGRTTTNTLAGAWVGEGAPKPVRRASFAAITLTPFKLAVISTFSEEMALYSTPAIEGIIRQAIQDDTAIALDSYLIDNVAASAVRPAGLLNGVTPITAAATGTATEKMVADLKAIVAALIAAGAGSADNIVLLVNPAQAIGMGLAQTTTGAFLFDNTGEVGTKFNGATIISSASVPAGTVIGVEASEFATATGDSPRWAVSNEATIHEEDTTPLPIGSTGTPTVVAAPTRSLFQTDTVAIRMTLYVTWKMRRAGMVQTIASVGW